MPKLKVLPVYLLISIKRCLHALKISYFWKIISPYVENLAWTFPLHSYERNESRIDSTAKLEKKETIEITKD